jgi:hypothetical protein
MLMDGGVDWRVDVFMGRREEEEQVVIVGLYGKVRNPRVLTSG